MGILEELRNRPPVTKTISIYLDNDALSEASALREEIRRVKAQEQPSLRSESAGLERKLQELEARLEDSRRDFVFAALSEREFEALKDAHPSKQEEYGFDVVEFPPALIAAASVDPALTVAEAKEVQTLVPKYEWDQMFGAAYSVQLEKPRLFTVTGIERTLDSGPSLTTRSS